MSQATKQPLTKYPAEFTFGVVNLSGAGKEYFTGYALIPDAEGNKNSYKCMSFRSHVFNQAKHLGTTQENTKALNGVPVLLEGYFKQNDRPGKDQGKYELFFDTMEFLNPEWAPISAWFNDPANQTK